MLRKRVAAFVIPLVFFATGAAIADTTGSGRPDTSQRQAQLSGAFSALDAVNQYSVTLSEMADKRAKSDLVKNYARSVVEGNAKWNEKLRLLGQKHGIEVAALDPQTEEGKSLLDRMKAETVLLSSLEGDAWDKEYMTLVTNTQQSVVHVLEKNKALAQDQDVKQFLADLTTTIQNRLKTAQDIMAKIYGNEV